MKKLKKKPIPSILQTLLLQQKNQINKWASSQFVKRNGYTEWRLMAGGAVVIGLGAVAIFVGECTKVFTVGVSKAL
jgi:hypothetical protein